MVRSVRSLLFLVVMATPAFAGPSAELSADADGDGAVDKIVFDGSTLHVTTKRGTSKVEIGQIGKTKLSAAVVKTVPTIIVAGEKDGVIVQLVGTTWKEVARTPIGPAGVDGDYAVALDARPDGIYRFQVRPGGIRCDGQPAYLFPEGFNGKKFQRLAEIPSGIPDTASVINAKPESAPPASSPSLFRARFASHQPGAMDAAGLAIPTELDDGKPDTAWREDFTASAGEGQFFTYVARVPTAGATQLRIVTTKTKANNRPKRLGVVAASGAWHVDVPDASPGSAFVADLPQGIAGCVTVVIESTYGPDKGETSIAELAVYGENEWTSGGEKALAHAVAVGKDGSIVSAQELARRGAAGVAAIDAELATTKDHDARVRLYRVVVAMKDPAAAPLLAKAVKDGELQGAELVKAITALAGTGMAQELHDLALTKGISLDARVAAVARCGPRPTRIATCCSRSPVTNALRARFARRRSRTSRRSTSRRSWRPHKRRNRTRPQATSGVR